MARLSWPFGKAKTAHPDDIKQSATSSLFQGSEACWVGMNSPRWSKQNYQALSDEGYRKNVIAHRCIRLISETAAAVPLNLFRGDQKLESHPVLDLLKYPSAGHSKVHFMEDLFTFLNIAGNCYVERVDGIDGKPAELYLLRPDRMKLVPGKGGWPKSYTYSLNGRAVSFPVDEMTGDSRILHIKRFHPVDDYYGLSPLESAAQSIDVYNAATTWNKALLDNAARPSGALVYEAKDGGSSLSREQFERLKQEMTDSFQGHQNAGRPLLLEGGLKWQQMSFSPSDLDFMAGKHLAAREIALAFGVPPMLLSIPGDNTYSNYQEANRALWRTTILPQLEKILSALNSWLLPLYDADLKLVADLDMMPGMNADRDALWQRVAAADFLTTDEKRRLVGFGPLDQKTGSNND